MGRPWNGLTFEAARDRWIQKISGQASEIMFEHLPEALMEFAVLRESEVWSVIGIRHIEESTGVLLKEFKIYHLERCTGDIWILERSRPVYLSNIYGERE